MLNVSGLKVAYGQSEVIHGLDFEVPKNETLAIMGRNGMGKTTLFKSLIGVLPLAAGKITVDGIDVSHSESYQRVENGIAYVPQGRMIFPSLTVQENIETGMEVSGLKQIPEDMSFTMAVADRIIVIDKGNFIHEDLKDSVDAEKIKGYLSV